MDSARSPIVLRILLFSVLRERLGRDVLEIELPAGRTGADLLDVLARDYPEIQAFRPVIRLAVNEAYEPTTVLLQAGDRVALITPVSGG